MLVYRHIKWGLISKLSIRVFSLHPWIPGTLKLDSILSLFKCVKENHECVYNIMYNTNKENQLLSDELKRDILVF